MEGEEKEESQEKNENYASQEVGRDLHVHNEMVMKEICKGGSKCMDI